MKGIHRDAPIVPVVVQLNIQQKSVLDTVKTTITLIRVSICQMLLHIVTRPLRIS